jgi:hypothetical protein
MVLIYEKSTRRLALFTSMNLELLWTSLSQPSSIKTSLNNFSTTLRSFDMHALDKKIWVDG